MADSGRVYIIIVNWNGWADTLECLSTVFRSTYPDFRVIVCDNGSCDDSVARITGWGAGALRYPVSGSPFGDLMVATDRHIRTVIVPADQDFSSWAAKDDWDLLVVAIGSNLGFAAGNNVGMRIALALGDCSYVWLLNNDTVVDPQALSAMVHRMEAISRAGMCGSRIHYYHESDKIWALGGGHFRKLIARSENIGLGRDISDGNLMDTEAVERVMEYPAGASMLVREAYLREVGLMDEGYFLYCEEPDWVMRGAGRFTLAYARDSIVYHKVAASTQKLDADALSAELRLLRSQLRFMARFHPLYSLLFLVRFLLASVKSLMASRVAQENLSR